MNKKIYIHIGTHKTGTSAIQDFLLLNRKTLARRGVLYPQKSRRDYVDSQEGEYIVPEKKYRNYAALVHLCRRKDKNVILSSETFSLITNVSAMKAALGDANAVIICYLRRQDNVLQSLYNQSVKGGGYYKDIGDFVFPHPLDYFELLGRWAAVFGKENIVVRPYEKQQFKDNDLISDFLSIVGLELTVDFARLAKNANPRLPLEALEYMRLLNSLLRDKKMSKAIKKRLIPYCLERFKDSTASLYFEQSLFTPAQKRAILERYAPSNQRVAREYLGRPDGLLFRDTKEDGVSSLPSRASLSDEIVSDITGRLCESRQIRKIMFHAIGQDVSAADEFTQNAHARISGVINRL
jgi:hypothetical protein